MSLEAKLESMEKQLSLLSQRVSNLEAKAKSGSIAKSESPEVSATDDVVVTNANPSQDLFTWAGQMSILPRIATLCFLLVFALILRTITDSHLVNVDIGSWIGIIYPIILICTGWRKYATKSSLAPVFTVTGIFLLIPVVVEIHGHFGILSIVPAFLIIIMSGVIATFLSYRYRVALPVWVGTFGMTAGGFLLDFPNLWFHYLLIVLLIANIAAFVVASVPRCSFLRVIFFLITTMTLPIWRQQLGTSFEIDNLNPAFVASLPWFLPLLGITATVLILLALTEIIRFRKNRTPVFSILLPSLSVLWAFGGFHDYASAVFKNSGQVGIHGTLAGIGLMAIAFVLARIKNGLVGASAFIIAGVLLLDLALPLVTHNALYSLPILSLLALGLAYLSQKWNSGIVRAISYAIPSYLSLVLLTKLMSADPGCNFALNTLTACCLTLLTAYQYIWARRTTPPQTPFFTKFDKKDLSAVLLLLSFLMMAFLMAREITYQILLMLPGEITNSFSPAQTVIVNLSVIVLIWFAAKWKNTELRNVAVTVTVFAGFKAFFDLIAYQGIPPVLSLFSFGVTAALESAILTRWNSHKTEK